MENMYIHSNKNNITNNSKFVSLSDVKKTQCIDKNILRQMINRDNINIIMAKNKVKEIIKSASNKYKLHEENNRVLNNNFVIEQEPIIKSASNKNKLHEDIEINGFFNDNFVIEPQTIIVDNNSKLDNILTYTTDIINEIRENKNIDIDIDFILSKVRLKYENNEVFKNKKKIFLLSFEDDTFKAVLEIEQKYLDIIIDWYESNNLSLDIEETEYQISEYIAKNELSNILYKNINYKYKDEYLNIYLPQMFNYLSSKKTLNKCQKKIFNSTIREEIIDISDNNLLRELGIIIPDNMIYEEDNNKQNKWISLFRDIDNIDSIDSIDSIDNANDNKYLAYNTDYNCLYPLFGDNCQEIKEKEIDKLSQKDLIIVLFNPIYLQSIVIENPNKDTLYVISNHNEYGFMKLFTLYINKSNKELNTFIKNEYHQHIFNNIEELNSCLNTTSGFIDYNNLNINKNILKVNEELQVKDFITNNFNITNNIEHRMKASELYDLIINSPIIDIHKDKINGFRNRLSKYLIELGLKKKRYNDGYYYYGIIDKYKNSKDSIDNLDINNVYNKLLSERDNIYKEIKYKDKWF